MYCHPNPSKSPGRRFTLLFIPPAQLRSTTPATRSGAFAATCNAASDPIEFPDDDRGRFHDVIDEVRDLVSPELHLVRHVRLVGQTKPEEVERVHSVRLRERVDRVSVLIRAHAEAVHEDDGRPGVALRAVRAFHAVPLVRRDVLRGRRGRDDARGGAGSTREDAARCRSSRDDDAIAPGRDRRRRRDRARRARHRPRRRARRERALATFAVRRSRSRVRAPSAARGVLRPARGVDVHVEMPTGPKQPGQ